MSDLISKQAVRKIIHKTIYQFLDVCEDDEEVPMSDKDKLLLEVNKAICNNLKALEKEQNLQPTCNQLATDCISRQATEKKLKKVVDEMALIFADIREKNVDDSVCGLCEYDCDHGLDGYAYECPGFERDDCFKLKEEYRREWTDLSDIPSVDPERKPGKWVHMVGWWECNQCHAEYTGMPTCMGKAIYEYCPMCGSRMEVDGE